MTFVYATLIISTMQYDGTYTASSIKKENIHRLWITEQRLCSARCCTNVRMSACFLAIFSRGETASHDI
jgi:hypothetical protein